MKRYIDVVFYVKCIYQVLAVCKEAVGIIESDVNRPFLSLSVPLFQKVPLTR